MPSRQTPIRIPKATKAADLAALKASKSKGGGAKASLPSATATAAMRRRIQELEQDKRLLREALDAMERKLKAAIAKGGKTNG